MIETFQHGTIWLTIRMARTEFDDNKLDDNKLTQVGLESSEMFLKKTSCNMNLKVRDFIFSH